ncbi:MAG: radical SAM protein [Anaerolineae bacterium]|jgi:coproporphyrinogen III oxidase-like Fe-S oxidoreductase
MGPEILDSAPPEVNVAGVRQEWLALRPRYHIADRHLPLPVWARRPFTESGPEAWQTLCRDVPVIDAGRAFCIYIHIPFCPERCHFCDCYSFRLASHQERHIKGYLDLLTQEVRRWSQLGTLADRPVSTVHLGGGTPTFLDVESLAGLVGLCREHLAAGLDTEWALESTAAELSPEMLTGLDGLGFTRLHVGVQSLQDGVRQALNRRLKAAAVLETINQAVEMGWIVSVDLIYGLPGQTLDGLMNDIRLLVAAGVNGFSLYELQLSSRNRTFVQQHGLDQRDRQINYFLAQAASRLLVALDYQKTLFNHFADDRDTNLYFTFPERGEDCLALGAVADGSFGDYHYRHPEYAAYGRSVNGEFPGLQGGLRRTAVENRLQPLTTALLAGRVPVSLFADPTSLTLLRRWRESLLLSEDPRSGQLCLTGNGSWFVGNMISELLDSSESAHGV